MRALGYAWEMSDNIGMHGVWLRSVLRKASREELDEMMTPEEREAWQRLPTTFTVWRGCYANNRRGLSWSLSEDVASEFPFLRRYRQEDSTPLLLSGVVSKKSAVLKLGRNEMEVITLPPVQVTTRELAMRESALAQTLAQ